MILAILNRETVDVAMTTNIPPTKPCGELKDITNNKVVARVRAEARMRPPTYLDNLNEIR